jgi:uncharacterized RDD family membrane protein YckC
MQWCADCGVEHEDWASVCAICGATLSGAPPASPPTTDHTIGMLHVGPLSVDQHARLRVELQSRRIPFELVDGELRFPKSRHSEVVVAVAGLHLVGATPLPEAFGSEVPQRLSREALSGTRSAAPRLTSTGRRVVAEVVGALLWGVALGLLAGVLSEGLGASSLTASVVGLAAMTLTNVTLVSRFGADPGKFVLGIRVVDGNDRWPRWGQALLRTAIVLGPYWGLGLLAALTVRWDRSLAQVLAWAPVVWLGLLVWSIQHDPQRQGWHDHVARTWVVERPPRRPRPPSV